MTVDFSRPVPALCQTPKSMTQSRRAVSVRLQLNSPILMRSEMEQIVSRSVSSDARRMKGRGSDAGFTLVELMVAMVIGLFMALALITLLVNVNRNNGELNKAGLMIESGRHAMFLLENDIAHAGYWGGFIPRFDDLTYTAVPGDTPNAIPDPCKAYIDWTSADVANLIGVPIQSYDIPSPVPTPAVPVCASRISSPYPRTDVLFVRHLEPCVPGVDGCTAAQPNELMFQIDRCGTTAPVNPFVMTTYPDAALNKTKRDCSTLSEIRRFTSTLYYVRSYSNAAGDGIPTLMRATFGPYGPGNQLQYKPAEALIEGVEGFRIEYGVDNISATGESVDPSQAVLWNDSTNLAQPRNRGDGIPDGGFIRCTASTPCTADQLRNAVVVRIYLLMRSLEKTPGYSDTKTYQLGSTSLGPFNDRYKRHLFTQTIRLTNISLRRQAS